MMPLIVVALLIVAPHLISSQSSKQEWLPDELPHPFQEPRKCGHNSDEPAYICDPNGLTGEHIGSINWVLKDAAFNSTRCPCSNFYCENYAKPRGYHIGVALVKRMKIQTSSDGKPNTLEDQAQHFASRLESNWNMGQCDEDIIIFYSHEDKVLAIYGGQTAMNNLPPYYRNLLSYRVGSRFSEGRVVEAINNLLYDLKVVLNCDSPNKYNCGLQEIRNGISSVAISMSTTVLAVLFSVFAIWKL